MRSTSTKSFKALPLPYRNGSLLTFYHGWENFDLTREAVVATPWAICIENDGNWRVGQVFSPTMGLTLILNSQSIDLQITPQGITTNTGGDDPTGGRITPDNWMLYVCAFREISRLESF